MTRFVTMLVLLLCAAPLLAGQSNLDWLTLGGSGAEHKSDTYALDLLDTAAARVFYIEPAGDVVLAETGGSTSDPDLSVAGYAKFAGSVEMDGSLLFDGAVTLGDAASDAITLTGYLTRLRVGTGSTADLTHGADDAFIEGQLEVDSTAQFDGNVTLGNSASADTVTFTSDILLNAGTVVTSPDGAYFTRLRVGTGSTPGNNSATSTDGVFVEGVLEADGDVQFDGGIGLGNAASDTITLTGYMTRLRVGTGSTFDLTHGADDAGIEGQLEVDGAARFDGSVTLGDSASADTVTFTSDITLNAGTVVTSPDGAYFTRLRVGTGSTPAVDSTTAVDGLFVEGTAEIDGAVRFDGAMTSAAITHSGDIVPSADNARALGASGTEYATLWCQTIDDGDGTVEVAAAASFSGAVLGSAGLYSAAGYTLSAGCSVIATNGIAVKDTGGDAPEPVATVSIIYYDSVADQIIAIKNDGGGGTGTKCVLGDFSP